jgi:hypothetical protein
MGLKMDDETLAKILGQEDYGVMENGFVLPTPTQQVPT